MNSLELNNCNLLIKNPAKIKQQGKDFYFMDKSSDTASEDNSGNISQEDKQVRELSLEEFNPKGTLALTLIYFVILIVLWFFMYFVEFVGHGPSILS